MSLQKTSYEFNIKNIDKNQYYISLLKECIKANLIDNNVIYTTQLELGKLLIPPKSPSSSISKRNEIFL